jgi:hypothetical protein
MRSLAPHAPLARLLLFALLALAAPLAGCGSRCLVTTTGSVTSELKCTATAVRSPVTGATALSVVVKGHTYDVFRFTADLGLGTPPLTTYDKARGGTARTEFGDCKDPAGCFFQVMGPRLLQKPTRAEVGKFSVTLTKVGAPVTTEAATSFPVSGTADLTLMPTVGNADPVLVHVKF